MVPHRARRFAQRNDLGMAARIAIADGLVAPSPDNGAPDHDQGSNRYFAPLCRFASKIEAHPHVGVVVQGKKLPAILRRCKGRLVARRRSARYPQS